MPRPAKFLGWIAIAAAAIVGAAAALLANLDWNQARPWLNAGISQALGRPFAIHGDLVVDWRAPPQLQSGWRKLLLWPHISAQRITLGNPDAGEGTRNPFGAAANLAEVRRAEFFVDPLALLANQLFIPALELEAPALVLQRTADGRNNWTLEPQGFSGWTVQVEDLRLRDAAVRLLDAGRHADLKAELLAGDASDRSQWQLSGTVEGAPLRGRLATVGILSLQHDSRRLPLSADLTLGKTAIGLQGTLSREGGVPALEAQLRLSGPSLARLYPLAGIPLPESAAFSAEGRLRAVPNAAGLAWTYQDFAGRIGKSDLAGTLEFKRSGERPTLSGEVRSESMQFDDLARLAGARTARAMEQRGGRVLPVQALRTEHWSSVDADLAFRARRILREKHLPIEDLAAAIRLKDGVLSLTLENVGEAGSTLAAGLTLDGRARTIKASLEIAARRLKLKQLFPSLQSMKTDLGEINTQVSLSATGNSVAALLGSSNGEIRMLMNRATVSRLLLADIGLNFNDLVLSRLFGDGQLRLNCLAGEVVMTEGLAVPRTFVVDTEESLVFVDGRINLVNEQVELLAEPHGHGGEAVSLRAPVHVSGSLGDPHIDFDVQAPQGDVVVPSTPVFQQAWSGSRPARQSQGCDSLARQLRASSGVSEARIRSLPVEAAQR